VTRLTHAVTGHQVETDDASVDFWKSAGYVPDVKPAARKAPAKKAAASKFKK
jgi:hypothetical protein